MGSLYFRILAPQGCAHGIGPSKLRLCLCIFCIIVFSYLSTAELCSWNRSFEIEIVALHFSHHCICSLGKRKKEKMEQRKKGKLEKGKRKKRNTGKMKKLKNGKGKIKK